MSLADKLRAEAERREGQNVTVCPNVRDVNGIAKQHALDDYAWLRPRDNTTHAWNRYQGMAVVLGAPSGNLANIEFDDIHPKYPERPYNGLSDYVRRTLLSKPSPPLMSVTARNHLHIWCLEPLPSAPQVLEVRYQGSSQRVELLAAGSLATIWPTPGYRWVNPDAEPWYGSVDYVWRRLSLELGLGYDRVRPQSFRRAWHSIQPTTAQIRAAQEDVAHERNRVLDTRTEAQRSHPGDAASPGGS